MLLYFDHHQLVITKHNIAQVTNLQALIQDYFSVHFLSGLLISLFPLRLYWKAPLYKYFISHCAVCGSISGAILVTPNSYVIISFRAWSVKQRAASDRRNATCCGSNLFISFLVMVHVSDPDTSVCFAVILWSLNYELLLILTSELVLIVPFIAWIAGTLKFWFESLSRNEFCQLLFYL